MFSNGILVRTFVLLVFTSVGAHACPWGPFGRDTIHPLEEVPEDVRFVGYATVLAVEGTNYGQRLWMRVVQSNRGFAAGEEFMLRNNLSSCSRNPKAGVGDTYFVAGEFFGKYLFSFKNRDVLLLDMSERQLAACLKNGCDSERRHRLESIVRKRKEILERASTAD